MKTLTMAVRGGKIRYIGSSTMPAWKFAQMTTLAGAKGYARPIAMQSLYNVVQREEEREMNALCADAGVGLIPYSPLAKGFLSGTRRKEGGGETERARLDNRIPPGTYRDCDFTALKRVRAIAAQRNATPTQISLAWLLSKPVVASPIVGATRLEYLDDAAKAADITLTADENQSLEQPYEWRVPPAP